MSEQTRLSERERIARSRGGPGATTTAPRLSASWRRSAHYGISLDSVNPMFTGGVDDSSLFYECGQEVLRGLHATLANEPVSLMLTDSEGLVLSRTCGERSLLRALDTVYLAPGFGYSERETGTTGLGLALADRAPSLVRADEHYCTALWGYTCAAVPVTDPATGELVGSVNLTTWARQSDKLLLALAQMAAGNTAALMLARGRGRTPRPASRGEVFRVRLPRAGDDPPPPELSGAWQASLAQVEAALAEDRAVAVVGEPGVGKTALLAAAHRSMRPQDRVLTARPPEPTDAQAWLALWSPELGKEHTSVIVGRVDALPSWTAAELARIFETVGGEADNHRARRPFAVTAQEPARIPEALIGLFGSVVEVPALRHRLDDVLPLAGYFGRQARGRTVRFTSAAAHALTSYHWPGNVAQLREVIRTAVSRADVVDARHLPEEVFSGANHRLTRLEAVERDEIVGCLAEPGTTVAEAAAKLGISRATLYRRIAQYGIRTAGRRLRTAAPCPPDTPANSSAKE
ncbi:GAF domain-containing protein [Pseudonocardia hispaniensis]|uniref:GAF domain-containing protein n=1 Tax=Pseudonocardia hispaniensis TaxID=904933 RepID=A0ABW1J0I8_9PSEU